ncbi:hypothetical protein [Nonomuraea sp. NPDC003804]|uniref:hypothetical protein n=1 Tax=Nonomuraea sp. NPDC003804 TaxID=3154547 RepID=UPI0033A6FD8B
MSVPFAVPIRRFAGRASPGTHPIRLELSSMIKLRNVLAAGTAAAVALMAPVTLSAEIFGAGAAAATHVSASGIDDPGIGDSGGTNPGGGGSNKNN